MFLSFTLFLRQLEQLHCKVELCWCNCCCCLLNVCFCFNFDMSWFMSTNLLAVLAAELPLVLISSRTSILSIYIIGSSPLFSLVRSLLLFVVSSSILLLVADFSVSFDDGSSFSSSSSWTLFGLLLLVVVVVVDSM